jgi:hypothetical protein
MDALLFIGLKCDKMAFENAVEIRCQLDLVYNTCYLTVVLQPMQDDVRHVTGVDTAE